MDSFAIFILTHGRPDNVKTYKTIKARGYTGRIVLLIDDQDATADSYHKRYGNEVEVFDKKASAQTFDRADNFDQMTSIVFARNAAFNVAERLGIRYFMQLDDDYTYFEYRYDQHMDYATGRGVFSLDRIIQAMITFLDASGACTIALAQGGDFIGGRNNSMFGKGPRLRRKAMNSFLCDTEKPVGFMGLMNEDVNTYTRRVSTGALFFTANQVSLTQTTSQSSPGGISDLYLHYGTYVKSFYTVMFQPSSVKVKAMGDKNMRLHHSINWKHTTPMILDEKHRKATA